jgi:2-polyprenyl-6-methoxyphenol hydroxylase-like FAD-dependent oxidoreductase
MSELPESTDVLVVGGGPTGLALAVTLALAQVRFAVVDAVPEGGNFSRATGTLPRTLELLEPLGITERLAELGNHAVRIRAFSGDRDRALVTLHLGRLATRFPFAVVLPQHVVEEVMLARLRELGGNVHRPLTLDGLAQDSSGVTATVTGPDGTRRTVRAAYVVGADGAHSAVRRLAAVELPGETFRQTFLLSDMQLTVGPPPDEIHLFFSRHGAVVMGHMPGDVFRVCISVDGPGTEELTVPQAQELLAARAPAGYLPKVAEVVSSSRTRVHHRVAPRFRSGRVLLAGDAAHLNSPIVGQGMNLGIQDGITLGTALAETLRTGTDTLDSYDRVRRPIARQAVTITDHINSLATTRSRWRGALRDGAVPILNLPPANRRAAARLARLVDR